MNLKQFPFNKFHEINSHFQFRSFFFAFFTRPFNFISFVLIYFTVFFSIFFLQVNGKDVSNLAHEDAVNEFLKASEPIVVEVRRRYNNETDSNEQQQKQQVQTQSQQEQQQKEHQQQLLQTINHTDSSKTRTIADPLLSPTPSIEKLPQTSSLSISPSTPLKCFNNETSSVAVQTDIMLCNSFENEYIFVSNELPISDGAHLNSQINHNSRHSSGSNNNNNNSSNNNDSSGSLQHPMHHHHHPHCNVLNECIVPPEIDIEVIIRI